MWNRFPPLSSAVPGPHGDALTPSRAAQAAAEPPGWESRQAVTLPHRVTTERASQEGNLGNLSLFPLGWPAYSRVCHRVPATHI